MAKIGEHKAEFHGKHFGKNVSVIIEKGKDKNPKTDKYDIYNEEKEGTVTVFFDEVKSFQSNGATKYLANIPISLLSEVIDSKIADEGGFGEMFDKCVANGKVWEIVRMIRNGNSEKTIECYAEDLNIPEAVIKKAYEVIENAKSQEA
ncbi:hypothetical protein MmarC5_0940 [Methanococcus maripaludis C5]|uniref:Uncharacterized protein n=1 Tax=Methanococcus maripaludis (strain C5 / ATCC BAA-1333) TaxID=402880 RepID=A4FYG2_METM5|nr:hypothetical protein [Methanococcus maripaludis]ABO35246.1 hypothetical protein MmarC5_0940 [Methanococcus maripaludis C5]